MQHTNTDTHHPRPAILDLCSGIGAGTLAALHLFGGGRGAGYVEQDEYCQQILGARIEEGHLPRAPIFNDLHTFASEWAARLEGLVDVIVAGPPCQPWRDAGAKEGARDERDLFPLTLECVRRIRPEWVLLENVTGLNRGGAARYFSGAIVGGFAALGYNVSWGVLGARDVGAPHRRDRLWIVAHADN